MQIRIPFFHKKKDALPLLRCAEFAAAETGVPVESVVLVLSAFFEQVAAEVTKGRVVRLPGFGTFGVHYDKRTPATKQNGGRPVPRPRFVPSNPFNQEVLFCAPVNLKAAKALETYRHSQSPARSGSKAPRVFTAQRELRKQIVMQLRD